MRQGVGMYVRRFLVPLMRQAPWSLVPHNLRWELMHDGEVIAGLQNTHSKFSEEFTLKLLAQNELEVLRPLVRDFLDAFDEQPSGVYYVLKGESAQYQDWSEDTLIGYGGNYPQMGEIRPGKALDVMEFMDIYRPDCGGEELVSADLLLSASDTTARISFARNSDGWRGALTFDTEQGGDVDSGLKYLFWVFRDRSV